MAYPFAAVLFDLDGVVIDTTELHYRVWEEFARERGIALTSGQLLATNGRPARETIRKWLGTGPSEQEVDAITAEREVTFHHMLETAPVSAVAGVEAFVAGLRARGVAVAVATSAVPANAELSLRRVGMAGAFGAVITAGDVAHGKPHPEVYLKAAAAVGVAARDCVVVEDSVSGLRAAKAAGARCVALTTTFPREVLAAESPDWLVADFRDLPAPLRL
jgi:beta-phosphoglucomutase family hydrolase